MRKILLIMMMVPSLCFGQNETLITEHVTGDSSLTTVWYWLNSSFNYLGTGSANASVALSRVDAYPNNGDTSLSGLVMPILANVTGSTSAQNVNVPTKNGLGAYLLLDGGLATQEVVTVTGFPDSTHFTAIVRNNHTTTTGTVRVVYSSFSKFIQAQILIPFGWPFTNITNFGFIRQFALPANVYDQYQTYAISGGGPACSYVEDALSPWTSTATKLYSAVPQYSSTSVSSTGNPTNAISISAGPVTSTSEMYPCVQVQTLFTSIPETPVSDVYQYWWDRN